MKEFLEKLIKFFQQEKEEDLESSIGIYLIGEVEPIELCVDADLKIECFKDHLYIDSNDYIGIIRIDRIVQIHEI